MAHVAQVIDGAVVDVHAIKNDVLADDGTFTPAAEASAQQFQEDHGHGNGWMLCSYNGNFRGGFPGKGWTYDAEADTFADPRPPEPPAEAV